MREAPEHFIPETKFGIITEKFNPGHHNPDGSPAFPTRPWHVRGTLRNTTPPAG
jgi:hypothetical protein